MSGKKKAIVLCSVHAIVPNSERRSKLICFITLINEKGLHGPAWESSEPRTSSQLTLEDSYSAGRLGTAVPGFHFNWLLVLQTDRT